MFPLEPTRPVFLVNSLGGVEAICETSDSAAGARAEPRWTTPWGDSDVQGAWSSDDARGFRLQRPEQFGLRAELTGTPASRATCGPHRAVIR